MISAASRVDNVRQCNPKRPGEYQLAGRDIQYGNSVPHLSCEHSGLLNGSLYRLLILGSGSLLRRLRFRDSVSLRTEDTEIGLRGMPLITVLSRSNTSSYHESKTTLETQTQPATRLLLIRFRLPDASGAFCPCPGDGVSCPSIRRRRNSDPHQTICDERLKDHL